MRDKGTPYTDEEIATIETMLRDKKTWREIGEKIGASHYSVCMTYGRRKSGRHKGVYSSRSALRESIIASVEGGCPSLTQIAKAHGVKYRVVQWILYRAGIDKEMRLLYAEQPVREPNVRPYQAQRTEPLDTGTGSGLCGTSRKACGGV